MAKQLLNKQGEEIRPRPEFTGCIIERGVLEALESGHLYGLANQEEFEQVASDICDHYYPHIDSYDLAKKMEDSGYDVDRDFVEDMEQIDTYIKNSHSKAVNDWAEQCEPQPPLEVGAELKISSWEGNEVGVIEGIYEHTPACYLVKLKNQDESDTSRRIIKFEDAVLNVVE